jgi:centromeric protein E
MDSTADSKKIRTSPISRRNSSNSTSILKRSKSSKDEKISVSIRIRPLNIREKNNSNVYEALKSSSKTSVTEYLSNGKARNNSTQEYDNVFNSKHSTKDIFDKVGKTIVNSCLGGINGTIFAYGQTSSGKTFTMNGDERGNCPGILPLSALHIFDAINTAVDREYLLRVSFVEIYNEVVTDLFNPQNGAVKIRESRARGVYVEAEEKIVNSFDDLMGVFALGNKNRHVASTNMNDRSSRSHTIFRITVESKEKTKRNEENYETEKENNPTDEAGMVNIDGTSSNESNNRRLSNESVESTEAADLDGAVLVGALSLVDLAGSENARNTGASGKTLREGGNINKSLLTLSGVIKALAAAKGKDVHVRFRDSKLTRILQPSLVGNCKTAVIGCVTPADAHLDETRSTLRFASSAKNLSTKTSVNEILDDASMIKRLKRELYKLRKNAALTQDSQALIELQNSNKANQEDLVKAEQTAKEYKKQALEAEQKFKKVQSIMAKQILNGNVGLHHNSHSDGISMDVLQSHQQKHQNKKRMSRRKKRETWCPGEMALPSTFKLAGNDKNFSHLGDLSNINESDESNDNNKIEIDDCDGDDIEESRVVENLSLLKPITKIKRRSNNRRRASVGGEQLASSLLKSSSSFNSTVLGNRRDSNSFGKSIIAKKDDRITILKNELAENAEKNNMLQIKFDDQSKAMEEMKAATDIEIERLRATIAAQQEEKFELVQNLKDKNDCNLAMKDEMSKLKAEISRVNMGLSNAEDTYKRDISNIISKNEKLLKDQEIDLKRQLDTILEEKSNIDEKLVASNHEIAVLKNEISHLKTEYIVENAKLTETKNAEIQSMQEVLIKAEQRADNIDVEAKKLMAENAILQKIVDDLHKKDKQLELIHTGNLQVKLQNIRQMRSKLAQTRDNALKLIHKAKKAREGDTTKDKETIINMTVEMDKLRNELNNARNQQHELEDTFADLQQKKNFKIRELEKMIESLKKGHEEKMLSIGSSSTELTQKNEELSRLLMMKESTYANNIKQLKQQGAEQEQIFQSQKNELEIMYNAVKQDCESYEKQNIAFIKEIDVLKQNINKAKESADKNQYENKQILLQQTNDNLKEQLLMLQKELNSSKHEKSVIASTFEKLKTENDETKKNSENKTLEIESLSEAIAELEGKNKLLKEGNRSMGTSSNANDVNKLQSELHNTTKKMEKALKELGPLGFKTLKLNKKVKQLEQELVVISNTLNKEQILRENVENKLVSSQKRYKALQKNLNMMREEHTNMTNDLESSAILQSQLRSSEETIENLRKEIKEKDERIKYLDAHKVTEHMKAKFKNIQTKYEKSKSDCSILKSKCIQLKKKLDQAALSSGERSSGDKNDKIVRLLQDKLRKYLDLNNELKREKEAICKLDYIKDLIHKKGVPLRDALKQLIKALKIAADKQKKIGSNGNKKEFFKLQANFVELKKSHDNIQSKLNEKVLKLEMLNEKYENVKGEKNEIKSVGARRLIEYKNEIEESKNKIIDLKAKLEKSNSVRQHAEEAHQESIRFLEKENLDLLLEVKKLKSAIDVVVGNNKNKTKNVLKAKTYNDIIDVDNDTADLTNYVLQNDKENSINNNSKIKNVSRAMKLSDGTKSKNKKLKDKRESLASLHDISIENFTDMTEALAGNDDFDNEAAPECTQQ